MLFLVKFSNMEEKFNVMRKSVIILSIFVLSATLQAQDSDVITTQKHETEYFIVEINVPQIAQEYAEFNMVVVSAKIHNISGYHIFDGTVRLRLTNICAYLEKIGLPPSIFRLQEINRMFYNTSELFSWNLAVPRNVQRINYEIEIFSSVSGVYVRNGHAWAYSSIISEWIKGSVAIK